ncbi:cytochrome P450 2H2-like [Marmota monax]|uniref:cytochrome P450 2H2-like n=1 Tax=Marmota monax TaxID=9995 RepID=UPI0026EBEE8D|nr:cytochrome P450 2H2-like [Marmota monax]
MGPKKVVVLSGYETVKEALVGYGNQFGERSQVPIFERIFNGKGIAFSHGETWKIMRRFSLTTLRNFGMGKQIIEDIIIEECQHLIQNLEAHRAKENPRSGIALRCHVSSASFNPEQLLSNEVVSDRFT